MDTNKRVIEVVRTSPGFDYLMVDGFTFSKGRHTIWNYSELESGPEFKKYLADCTIVLIPDEPPGT
jgi:hypothetical protein